MFIRNFVLCIHVQIRFASTEKNYSHRLACILFELQIIIGECSIISSSYSIMNIEYAFLVTSSSLVLRFFVNLYGTL